MIRAKGLYLEFNCQRYTLRLDHWANRFSLNSESKASVTLDWSVTLSQPLVTGEKGTFPNWLASDCWLSQGETGCKVCCTKTSLGLLWSLAFALTATSSNHSPARYTKHTFLK